MSWFIAWISPPLIESSSVRAPASCTASRGFSSSTCSTPSVARIAIVRPPRLFAMVTPSCLSGWLTAVLAVLPPGIGRIGRPQTRLARPDAAIATTSMRAVNVSLPDGTELELADGATGADAAAAMGAGLARAALAVRQNGEVRDLARPLKPGEPLEIITPASDGALDVIRHDA